MLQQQESHTTHSSYSRLLTVLLGGVVMISVFIAGMRAYIIRGRKTIHNTQQKKQVPVPEMLKDQQESTENLAGLKTQATILDIHSAQTSLPSQTSSPAKENVEQPELVLTQSELTTPATTSSVSSSHTSVGSQPSSPIKKNAKQVTPGWTQCGGVKLNDELFSRGIVVFNPLTSIPTFKTSTSAKEPLLFSVGNRKYRLTNVVEKVENKKSQSKRKILQNQLQALCESDDTSKRQDSEIHCTNHKGEIYSQLVITAELPIDPNLLSRNPRRKLNFDSNSDDESEETFLKNQRKKKKIGFYIYPWFSGEKQDFPKSGFSTVVTAGCMFGAQLKAKSRDSVFPMVKHERTFLPGEKIDSIEYNPGASNAFKAALLKDFENTALLIKKLGGSKAVSLSYHLPYLDYLLFGIELFLRGRMPLHVLNEYFLTVLFEKEEYIEAIRNVCDMVGIKQVEIGSPFENLFGDLNPLLEDVNSHEYLAQHILKRLELPLEEIEPEINIEEQREIESNFVKKCLDKLKSNSFNKGHQAVWQDFALTWNVLEKSKSLTSTPLSLEETEEKSDLEKLFRMGNAVMVAGSTKGKRDNEVAVLEFVSEKQIQIVFQRFSRQLPGHYPSVVNLTLMEPIIAEKELLFYFAGSHETLVKLIEKKEILETVHHNIAASREGVASVTVEGMLNKRNTHAKK